MWGNDREVMTYDNAGNAYFGGIAKTDGTKLTIASGFDPKSHSYTNEVAGGAVVVVSGTGAGQATRLLPASGLHSSNSSSKQSCGQAVSSGRLLARFDRQHIWRR